MNNLGNFALISAMKQIMVPGSKSVSCRALVLAALSSKPMVLRNILDCDDTRVLQDGLASFGVKFKKEGNDIRVVPPAELTASGQTIPVGNAGTPARFLSALSVLISGEFTIEGSSRMAERPMEELFSVLKLMSVEVSHQEGFLPATFSSSQKKEKSVEMSSIVSSQFLSALLLVGAKLAPFTIHLTKPLPSTSYVQMTIDLLNEWGITVENNAFQTFTLTGSLRSPEIFSIPPDYSAMTYPIAYSLLNKKYALDSDRGCVQLENIPSKTYQGDEQFLAIAEQFGAQIIRSNTEIEIQPPETLQGLGEVDFSDMLDTVPSAAILASVAKGETTFTNIGNLRYKESDRIEAIVENLKSLGVQVESGKDWIKISPHPQPLSQRKRVVIQTHYDHRIAMAFGVLGKTRDLDLQIDNKECVSKSWPNFWLELADWGGEMRSVSAVIVSNQDKYLIVKKPRKNHAWQFPQGGVEIGETLLETAERELREECGKTLQVKFVAEKVGEYAYFFPTDFKRHEEEIVGAKVSFFQAEFISGDIVLEEEELEDYKWVTKEELKDYFEGEYLEKIQSFL